MRVFSLAALAAGFLLAACATADKPAPTPAKHIDADPLNLQIEIGRYSALLGQVVEHTGVSYEHAGHDDGVADGPPALMNQLNAAVTDYNRVRAALCASKAGAATYAKIRADSCHAQFRPDWRAVPLTNEIVARRSNEAGAPIIGLWDTVCDEAKRLQPAGAEEPVCPME